MRKIVNRDAIVNALEYVDVELSRARRAVLNDRRSQAEESITALHGAITKVVSLTMEPDIDSLTVAAIAKTAGLEG